MNRTAAINQNISDHESRANIPANSRPTKTSLLKPDQAGALFACLYHRVDRHCPLQTAALYLISSVKSHQMRFLTTFLSWRRCTRSRVVKRAIVHAVNFYRESWMIDRWRDSVSKVPRMTSQGKQIQMAMTSRTTSVEVSRDDVSSMSERVESI